MFNEQELIADAISLFPTEFRLRGFPGKTFRLSQSASYYSPPHEGNDWVKAHDGQVMLYTAIKRDDGTWGAFAKGTIEELRPEIVEC